jgi:hypothetical protein
MIFTEETTLEHLCINYVGNQTHQEALVTSDSEVFITDEMKALLKDYFLKNFKPEIFFEFFHSSNIENNEVFTYVSEIFEQPELLENQSKKLAKLLYEHSTNPRTKGGEFYVCFFKDCIVKGERYDAVGLFKSENKDTFLKVSTKNDVTLSGVEVFELETLQGINLNKVDKGCLIYNTNKEQGYLMSIIDGTSRAETSYWMDDFLQVRQRQDEYFETQETFTLYKEYITKQLPQEFEITKADQADFLNKSLSFFKEKEEFKMEEFTGEVLKDQEVIQSFNAFKTQYEDERDYALSDEFAINDAAVKKNARIFKSVIKLDKNFHIYIHGDRKLIQQGQDENGKYYMLYFEEEN